MTSAKNIYEDKIQDQLERLAVERTDRLGQIASQANRYNEHQLYLTIQKDSELAAIDMELARVLSTIDFQLKLV